MAEVKLTLYERETIINYNEAEDKAEVYTCSPSLIRKLKILCEEFPQDISLVSEDRYSVTISLPKKLVSIRRPIKFSEEQKLKMREKGIRLSQLRKEQKNEISDISY